MRVRRDIGGSILVVFKNSEHYLDAKKYAHLPGSTFVELVRNGQVFHRESLSDQRAPDRIVSLMRRGLTPG